MSRPIYVYWMREDNGRRKYGMMVNCYDPVDWGHDELQEWNHFSPWMRTVYWITKHDREEKDFYWNGMQQVGPKNSIFEITVGKPEFNLEHKDYRASTLMIDEVKAAVSLDNDMLSLRMKDGQPIEITDCTGLKAITKETASVTDFPVVKAIHAVFGGLHTHGTAGDYADIIAVEADLGAPLTSLLEARTISSQALAGVCLFNTSFGVGETLNITSDTPHGGDITAGWTISISGNAHCIQTSAAGDAANFGIQDISLARTNDSNNDLYGLLTLQKAGVHTVKNLFLDGGGFRGSGTWMGNTGNNVLNNISIRDCDNWGFYDYLGTGVHTIKQMLVEGCLKGADVNLKAATYINCGFVSNGDDVIDPDNATADYVFDVDGSAANGNWGTGTNCKSVTAADEWELNDAIAAYAAAKAGGSTSLTDPGAALMDGAWADEVGPKQRQAAAGIARPLVGGSLANANLINGGLVS